MTSSKLPTLSSEACQHTLLPPIPTRVVRSQGWHCIPRKRHQARLSGFPVSRLQTCVRLAGLSTDGRRENSRYIVCRGYSVFARVSGFAFGQPGCYSRSVSPAFGSQAPSLVSSKSPPMDGFGLHSLGSQVPIFLLFLHVLWYHPALSF